MRIATSSSSDHNPVQAIQAVADEIFRNLSAPSLMLLYYTETQDAESIRKAINHHFPNTCVIGCSSCQGTMTDKGFVGGHSLAVWAVDDPQGAYGAALCELKQGENIFESAKHVLRRAIDSSGRSGELPALVTLHATLGCEETILQAIRDELGVNIPIIGGSAADDGVSGKWSLLDNDRVTVNGIAMAVFFPSARVSYSFHNGYAPMGPNAIATKVDGRTLVALDDQPAFDVYAKWYREANGAPINPDTLFEQSTLFPLGRQTGEVHGMPYYTLSHPASVSREGGIQMFCNLQEGDIVHFMSGTTDMLVSRAGRVVYSANDHDKNPCEPIGGLAIYCAGCMLHVRGSLHSVAANMRSSMHHAPFICPFTFGEQGLFLGGEIAHGNLMISAVLFHKDEL